MYIVLTTYALGLQQPTVQSGDMFSFDSLFKALIHPGDTYISCIVNRTNRSECFYEGIGTVGEILSTDGTVFYAKLEKYHRFENRVPLILPDGKFVEHLGRESSALNPFTSTRPVRLLKSEAYDYILKRGGKQLMTVQPTKADCQKLEGLLKTAIRSYFVDQRSTSVFNVERISRKLGQAVSVLTPVGQQSDFFPYMPSDAQSEATGTVLEVQKELQNTRACLDAERQRRELLELELNSSREQQSEEVNSLTAALQQSKEENQKLVLCSQQQEIQLQEVCSARILLEQDLASKKVQLSELEDRLAAADDQQKELQTSLNESRTLVDILEQERADLLQRCESESCARANAENALTDLQEMQLQTERIREQKDAELSVLMEQVDVLSQQNNALQAEWNISEAHNETLKQECSELSQQCQSESLCRSQAEEALRNHKEVYTQTEQNWIETSAQKDAEIEALKVQFIDKDQQCKLLQAELEAASVCNTVLKQECTELSQQCKSESYGKELAEKELADLKKTHIQAEQSWFDDCAQKDTELDALRVHVNTVEQQSKALLAELDASAAYAEDLKTEYADLTQKYKSENLLRVQAEQQILALKEELDQINLAHAAEDNQRSINIRNLEQKVRSLENDKEKLALELRTSEYRRLGVCQHCGGVFSGFFKKKCSVCGLAKDY